MSSNRIPPRSGISASRGSDASSTASTGPADAPNEGKRSFWDLGAKSYRAKAPGLLEEQRQARADWIERKRAEKDGAGGGFGKTPEESASTGGGRHLRAKTWIAPTEEHRRRTLEALRSLDPQRIEEPQSRQEEEAAPPDDSLGDEADGR